MNELRSSVSGKSDNKQCALQRRPAKTLSATMFGSLLLFLACLCPATQSPAQSSYTTGTVRGEVLDPQGASIPDATITVTNPSTGTVRSVTSKRDGSYQVPQLNPGTYTVEVSVSGFNKLTVQDVALTVGQTVTYDAHLAVGSSNTVVDVSGTAAVLIDQTQTQQANTIDERQQINLPNLSRNFAQQLFTLPGVTNSNAASVQDPNVGTGYQSSGASFGGGNGRGNLFTIDGGENDFGSGSPRVAHVPQDSVQEFQVNRSSFNAEFGFTVGSAINVVTKSGTDKFHGSAFGYFHDETTDAVNYFNSYGPTAGKRPFEQSAIFGGSVGGPIKKNKLFFFASFERQKLDNDITTNLLGTAEVQGLAGQTNGFNGVSCPAPVTQACYITQLTALGAGGLFTSITPALSPINNPQFVNLVAPDSGTFDGNALGAVQSAPGANGRYNNFVTHFDYTQNEKNTYSLRLSYSHEQNVVTGASGTPRFTSDIQQLRDYTITSNWNHVFNPNLVNTVRVQVVPHNSSTNNVPHAGAEFDFGSLSSVGGPQGTIFDFPYNQTQNQYQFDDDLSVTKGSHSLKFGASFRPVQFNIFQAFLFGGDYQFQDGAVSLYALFAGAVIPGTTTPVQTVLGGINNLLGYGTTGPASTNLSAAQDYDVGLPIVLEEGAGNGVYHATEKPLGVYVQDSWKATRNLTLNYGGRFDFDPTPNNYRTTFFGSPRAGLAWNPFGDGKTVVRAGGGLFTAPVLFIVPFTSTVLSGQPDHIFAQIATAATAVPQLEGALAIEKSEATAANPNPALTLPQLASVGLPVTSPGNAFFTVDPNFKQQYSIQGSASVIQQLAPNLSFELGYIYYAGVHIQQIQEGNLVQTGVVDPFVGPFFQPKPGSTNGAPNATITQNDETTSAGHSTYNGLTASLTKAYGHGLQFQANYTWSKAIDNVSDFSSQSTPFRPGFLNLDRAVSDFNIKNSFVANAVYTSPTHHSGDSFARILYTDFVIAPIVQVRDGVPFTELVPGIGGTASNGNSSHTGEARPFNEGRNLGIGPGYADFDLRISRAVALKRDSPLRLNLIAQSSNVLNHTNFTSVQNIFPNTGTSSVAGGPTTSAIVSTPEGNVNLLNGPYNLKGFRPVGATQLTDPLAFKTSAPPRQISFGLELAF